MDGWVTAGLENETDLTCAEASTLTLSSPLDRLVWKCYLFMLSAAPCSHELELQAELRNVHSCAHARLWKAVSCFYGGRRGGWGRARAKNGAKKMAPTQNSKSLQTANSCARQKAAVGRSVVPVEQVRSKAAVGRVARFFEAR